MTEPRVIVMRNRTDQVLVEVGVWRAERKQAVAVISPVPARGQQVYVRRPGDGPLPKLARVRWVDAKEQVHEQEISLAELLRDSTGMGDEMLVITVNEQGAAARLEYVPVLR